MAIGSQSLIDTSSAREEVFPTRPSAFHTWMENSLDEDRRYDFLASQASNSRFCYAIRA